MINIVDSDRGKLTAIDLTNLPFVPKRIFIVDKVEIGGIRSDHAHHKDSQILYCLSGSLSISKIFKSPEGLLNQMYILNPGDKCEIPPLTWSIIKFLDNNSSFICICSESYDEQEYIRNYEEFLRIINDTNV